MWENNSAYLNYAQSRSWNQPVLRNVDKDLFLREQRKTLMGARNVCLTGNHQLQVGRSSHWATLSHNIKHFCKSYHLKTYKYTLHSINLRQTKSPLGRISHVSRITMEWCTPLSLTLVVPNLREFSTKGLIFLIYNITDKAYTNRDDASLKGQLCFLYIYWTAL